MAGFLSDAWFEEWARRLAARPRLETGTPPVRVRQVIETSEGVVSYTVEVGDSGTFVRRDDDGPADLVLHADAAVAAELHDGAVSAQEAVARGRLRVSGRLQVLADPRLAAQYEQ